MELDDITLLLAVVALAFCVGYYINNQRRHKRPLVARKGITLVEFYLLVFVTSFIVMFMVLYWGVPFQPLP